MMSGRETVAKWMGQAAGMASSVSVIGGLSGIVASLVALWMLGLDVVSISSPFQLYVSRSIMGIGWALVGLLGGVMVGRDPKVPATFAIAGAVGGVLTLGSYFVVPGVLMLAGGVLFFLRKRSRQP
ncbi:MAG: hypothetical protein HYU29_03850 [Chloroflexi bacterium]|nr:hypothetical protein [Chloroflexota bacterium]